MKNPKTKIVYIPEPDQHKITLLVRNILAQDSMTYDTLVSYLIRSYNELRKVDHQPAEKIIQIDGR